MSVKIKQLKCETCKCKVDADHEQVALALDTCRAKRQGGRVACGLQKIVDVLYNGNVVGVTRKQWTKIDPMKVAFYPHKECQFCGQDAADAYECRASLQWNKDRCPLAMDEKKQLPALLKKEPEPLKHIREVIAEARAKAAQTTEPEDVSFDVPDPIVFRVDKKGYYHHVINPQ